MIAKYKKIIAKDKLDIIKEVDRKNKFIDLNKYIRII